MEWVSEYWQALTWGNILLGVGLFLLSLILSFAAIAIVMVKIPANYFSPHYQEDFMPDSPWLVRWGVVILKNIFGAFLVLLGVLLSLPGVPEPNDVADAIAVAICCANSISRGSVVTGRL